jgi:hypothetical protein
VLHTFIDLSVYIDKLGILPMDVMAGKIAFCSYKGHSILG